MSKQARTLQSLLDTVDLDRYRIENEEPIGKKQVLAAIGRNHVIQAFIGPCGGLTVRLNGNQKVWTGRDAKIAWNVYVS